MPQSEPGAERRLARTYAYAGGSGFAREAFVAVEAAVALEFGGLPHAVMMATPADLEDFAYGFALTEGIIERAADIRAIEVIESAEGHTIRVALSGERLGGHLAKRRALVGRTSCGLCGVEDFSQLPKPARVSAAPAVSPGAVKAALGEFARRQRLNALTHSVHGAAWCGSDGAVLALREDVGRHNALDKLIGALMRAGTPPQGGFLLISSRCSLEMVAKAARFGASTLVSVSAPTTLALDAAERLGVMVIAVARDDHALAFEPLAARTENAA